MLRLVGITPWFQGGADLLQSCLFGVGLTPCLELAGGPPGVAVLVADFDRKSIVRVLCDSVHCHAFNMACATSSREATVCVQNGKLTHYRVDW
jgi:hypothetical protein